ncbi:STAS domain-containing protein, partial [Kibdelosporangium lantanae]
LAEYSTYLKLGTTALVIDMTEVSFLSATGLSVLVAAREETRRAGIELRLVASRREVLRPLQVTDLIADFDIYLTIAEAQGGGGRR